jgi:diguanylate cyclase (GGDEF)-like protein/PAS domain S-box-containing protein
MLRYPLGPEQSPANRDDPVSARLQEAVRINSDMGTYLATVPYDQVRRTISYRRMSGWPLYVLVGVSEGDYLEKWHGERISGIAMAIFFLLVSLLFSWLLYRYWRERGRLMKNMEWQQDKFRSLASMSSDWFWEQDSHFRFTEIARNPAHWSAASTENLIGKSLWEWGGECDIAEAQAHEALEKHRKLVQAHKPFEDFEYCLRDRSGKHHILSLCGEPVTDEGGRFVGYRGIAQDITARRKAEERERLLMRMYQTLSATNEAIIHAESEEALFPLVCRIATELGGMTLSWVGVPDKQGRFVPVASHGKATSYLEDVIVLTDPDKPEGRGLGGPAFREGVAKVFNHVERDEIASPWRDKALQHGIRAAAAFPVSKYGEPYAIWVVYSDKDGAFQEEILRLLDEIAVNLGFAVGNIEHEMARRDAEQALKDNERRFRSMYENAPLPYQSLDIEGNILEVNSMWLSMLGYVRDEVIGRFFGDFVAETSMTRPDLEFPRFKAAGKIEGSPFEMICKNGSRRLWLLNGQIARDNEGNFLHTHCIFHDITERHKAEEELKLAAMVYQESGEGMVVTDAGNRVLSVNPAFERITGYRSDESLGKSANDLLSGSYEDNFYRAIDQALQAKGYWKGELWGRRKNGQAFAIFITINTSYHADGSINKRLILLSDITRRKETDELLWSQANFDALTGLPNRNLFRDHLRQEMRKARRNNTPLALMFLDLDGFKDVNDTMGHDMGDLLLKQAAERLQATVRDSDNVARLGGDEFAVILTEISDASDVKRVARNILQKLSEPYLLGDQPAHVSVSIGITLYPGDALELESLLKNADQAMYVAKRRGRNQYQYFTQSMQDTAQARMSLVNDMRGALDNDQFEIVYQPIVELATGVIRKAEALLRWKHPVRGMVNPAEFIPAAEDTGMINVFGDWMFHQAARQAAEWREKYRPDFQISVNISPVQFKKEGIDSALWFNHLKNLGLPAQGIVVEITEGLLLETSPHVTGQLLSLRDAGIEVALDDFGVGYSSLAYLKKFDIDYLKIDQAFVKNLAPGSNDMALCEAIIVMAHKLGLKVIAEGVENAAQRDLLAASDCDYAQGYLYAGPLRARELENLLKSDPFISGPTTS